MPQPHLLQTKGKAFATAGEKLYQVEDRLLLVVNAHLIIESLLFRFICSKIPNPDALQSARLTFAQIHSLAQALRPAKKSEAWFWRVTKELNSLRNVLVHNIEIADLEERTNKLIKSADSRIDIYADATNPLEREKKALQFFFIILCGIAFNLTDETFEV